MRNANLGTEIVSDRDSSGLYRSQIMQVPLCFCGSNLCHVERDQTHSMPLLLVSQPVKQCVGFLIYWLI